MSENKIWRRVGEVVVVAGIYCCLRNAFGWGIDDTDKDGWHRSGVAVITDHATGLQYLETWTGGITPRMNADGTQRAIRPSEGRVNP